MNDISKTPPHVPGGVLSKPKKGPASTTAVAALGVSIISLIVAATNFYFTQWREPSLEGFVAPTMFVYYQLNGHIGLHVPVGFINKTARGGAVLRARLLVGRADDDKTFELEWTGFSETSSGNPSYIVTEPGPVAVGSTSVVGKVIQFKWPADWPADSPELLLLQGKYHLEIQLWTEDTSSPSVSVQRTFQVTKSTADTLLDRRQKKDNTTLAITFDAEPQAINVSTAGSK